MAHHVTSKDIPQNGERIAASKLALPKMISVIVAIVGGIGSYFLFQNETFGAGYSYSWLFAFLFFTTLALGGCFWVTLHHVTNSGWGVSVRRLMENLGFVFPFMAIIAIPLMLPSVQDDLYEWMTEHRTVMAEDAKVHDDHHYGDYSNATHALHREAQTAVSQGNHPNHYAHLLYVKSWYMNLPFWLGRVIFFFVALGGGIWWMRKLSIAQDSDPHPGVDRLIFTRRLSCAVMPIFAVTATFIAIDFMMGLDYKWFSTMYGVCFFAGCAINSMAVLILLLTWLRSMGYMKPVTSKEHYHIMGKLLHAFVIFWAYVNFSQFMLIWYANIPEETTYFLLRNTGPWWYGSISLTFLHFALPFVVLLPHYVKKTIKFIVPVCLYMLTMHVVDLYISIMPERGPSLTAGENPQLFLGHAAYLGDIVAFLTVGGFFTFCLLRNIGSANLYPNRDPRILESANLHN